jgi:isopenicillin N synthase-like dioxygenase
VVQCSDTHPPIATPTQTHYIHAQMATQVRTALRDFGFMFLANHGLSSDIKNLRAHSMTFFHLPEDHESKTQAFGEEGKVGAALVHMVGYTCGSGGVCSIQHWWL